MIGADFDTGGSDDGIDWRDVGSDLDAEGRDDGEDWRERRGPRRWKARRR